MSKFDNKGRWLEQQVAATIRKKLGARITRDSRSGAGETNKADLRDYFQELPLHVEVKNQETVKIKEWFRQASDAASYQLAPTVVFSMEEEILATLRFSDLVNFLVEIADLRAEVDDLRAPVVVGHDPAAPNGDHSATVMGRKNKDGSVSVTSVKSEPSVIYNDEKMPISKALDQAKKNKGGKITIKKMVMCRAGHVADEWGYCMQKGCKYSRGYKPPKGKAKR